MNLYKEFEDALTEVSENAGETTEFGGRFCMLIKNFMNGMSDLSDIDDLIQEAMIPGEENEN